MEEIEVDNPAHLNPRQLRLGDSTSFTVRQYLCPCSFKKKLTSESYTYYITGKDDFTLKSMVFMFVKFPSRS
jgi:hypothetical protein